MCTGEHEIAEHDLVVEIKGDIEMWGCDWNVWETGDCI